MQTARPVFVCLCSSGRRGRAAAWSCGVERQAPAGQVSLAPLLWGRRGSVPPAPAQKGQLLPVPAPELALGWGSSGAPRAPRGGSCRLRGVEGNGRSGAMLKGEAVACSAEEKQEQTARTERW